MVDDGAPCSLRRRSEFRIYKWLLRYQLDGPLVLVDFRRAPRSCPHQTASDIVALILEEHTRHGWDARNILKRLRTRDPVRVWPARSTVFDILARHDRVTRRRRRQHWKHPRAVPCHTTLATQMWTIDFKGQFRMREGVYCYPLTVLERFSRYLLWCHGLLDVTGAGVKPQLRRRFRTWGLPDAIQSDNGAPFASTGIHGLSTLSVGWLQLGIAHPRITPGSPQEDGAHERPQIALRAKAKRPAGADLKHQQLHSGQQLLSQALHGDYVGLEEAEDGIKC